MKNIKKIFLISSSCGLLFLFGCNKKTKQVETNLKPEPKNTQIKINTPKNDKAVFKRQNGHFVPIEEYDKLQSKKELITIFVHGTVLPYPSATNTIKTLKGDKNSPIKHENFWHKYINNLRFEGLYRFQPIQDLGLQKIDLENKNKLTDYQECSQKIANVFLSVYKKNNKAYKNYIYYTFGWSGRLDKERRLESGMQFYDQLVKVVKKIRKRNKDGLDPDVQIFAHSHGGNVALNLAAAEAKNRKNLKIKDLVLLGTPVQTETKGLISSGVFSKVYSFYSKGDDVQIIDFVSTQKHHSRRTFRKVGEQVELPKKLVQVQVKCDKLKPRHSELWITKTRANLMYRDRLSIAPYPVSFYVPDIINLIEKYFKNSNSLKVNIRKGEKNLKNITIKDFDDRNKKTYNLKMPF
ncbi:MAG: hypothetical protein SZ59_C0002G0014 [candidate division TM6 bacterium GW2011_GWF2_28_16]|nr:MAG: hypothetical protein SZ59_C0002G0014 [candidate division TM6 bacterium GW2011_GWF2_28_16]